MCVCQTHQQSAENVRYELDEYYFMPAPSQLVFTHFPEDPDWQLLERPIDLEEFESLVPLKPTFFKYGLHLLSHTNGVIHCTPGHDVSIRIECPRKKVIIFIRFFCIVTTDILRSSFWLPLVTVHLIPLVVMFMYVLHVILVYCG